MVAPGSLMPGAGEGHKMAINVNAHFYPLRLQLRKHDHAQLGVEITNRDAVARMLTLEVLLSGQLAFDKGGLKQAMQQHIANMEPGQTKNVYYDVYPKHSAQEGEHPVRVVLMEHRSDPRQIVREQKKNMSLSIVG